MDSANLTCKFYKRLYKNGDTGQFRETVLTNATGYFRMN